MAQPPITVTLITLNEEACLARALESVRWADEVIVVDSGSTDRTVAIARESGAKVETRAWPGYGQQKNFAQSLAKNDWVLNIDADEVVSSELAGEIRERLAKLEPGVWGFELPRRTYYLKHWIRFGGWYPNYLTRLGHRGHCSWSEPEVHEELVIRGGKGRLSEPLDHYSFESIGDQVLINLRYARLGARALREKGATASVPKLVLKPIGKFLETYFLKRGFLDGLAGFIISVNAAYSMFMKQAFALEDKLRKKGSPSSAS